MHSFEAIIEKVLFIFDILWKKKYLCAVLTF